MIRFRDVPVIVKQFEVALKFSHSIIFLSWAWSCLITLSLFGKRFKSNFSQNSQKNFLKSRSIQRRMCIRAGENFQSSMPQTKLNLLDQNLIPIHFWGQSGAGKVWAQAILGQPFYPLMSLDLKWPGATLSQPPIDLKNGLESDFDLISWVLFEALNSENFRQP